MNKLNVLSVLFLFGAAIASYGQSFSGEGTIDVKAELVTPLTVTSSELDFKRVAIPTTGTRFYHVEGDGTMYSADDATTRSAVGDQNDFEGSPTVSNVIITGAPDTAISFSGAPDNLTNADGSVIRFYPRYFSAGTTTVLSFNANTGNGTTDSNGALSVSLGGVIRVYGLDETIPNTPGAYAGTTVLTVQY